MKSSKFDPVALLKLMGVTVNEEESAKVVEVVLETARSGDVEMLSELSDPEIRAFQASAEKSLIRLANPDQILEPEAIFFARMACSTAMESPLMTLTQRDDALNKVVPDIPVLCEIFQRHAVRLIDAIKMEESETEDNECFICLQLLNLAKATDLQEEGSRRHFSSVMKRALLSGETPDDLVEGCVLAMCAAHEHEQGFLETIVQTASELSGEEVDDSRLLRIISILTIVLENASSKISTNVAVQDFARYIIPAVAHSNPLVREAGISCFGKLGLFTNESTVLEEFKPILLKAAFDEDEKLEIRGQALLALSDWSMLFSDMLQPSNVEGKDLSFLDLVKTLMIHPRQGIAAIAAEVAAKLLFSGRICESTLIAQLLLLFFDPTMTEADGDDSEVKEVGSPVRLQQLLSLFFPAYCINSEIGRDAVMGSISSMLNLVHQKPKTKKRKAAMPVVKMIEYICSIVDAGRRVSSQAESGELSTSNASSEKSQSAIMPSTALVSSLQVAQFLIQESSNLTNTTVRALCKFIGGHDIDVQIESKAHLLQLQEYLEELGMLLTDAPSLRSMALLNDSLVGVEDEENGRVQNDDSSEATETEDEMESTGETTLEDSLMDSMLALSVKEGKENMKAPSKAGISKRSVSGRRSRASSIGSSIGNVSVFESIGN
jgi:condensin complex subunit 3